MGRSISIRSDRLALLLRPISSLLIVTHNNPDPDAIGAALGLARLARAFRVDARIYYGGLIGRPETKRMVALLKIRRLIEKRPRLSEYDAIGFVDCQAEGDNHPLPGIKAYLEIDHHPRIRKGGAKFSLVDSRVGATSTIITELITQLRIGLSPLVATGLFYGIKSDTRNLSRGATNRDIKAYSHLFPLVDKRKLARIENPERSRLYYRLLTQGLRRSRICGNFAHLRLGPVENLSIIPELADLLIDIKGVSISLVLGEKDGVVHFSIRTRGHQINAGRLAQFIAGSGGAGGHEEMGGGRIPLPESRGIISKVKQILRLKGEDHPLI